MFDSRFFRRADFVLLGAIVALIAIGCLMVYSCTRAELAQNNLSRTSILKKQLLWVALGMVALVLMMSFDYSRLSSFRLPIYGTTLALLGLVLLTPPVLGARRWFHWHALRLQPGELAPLALVLMVSSVLALREAPRDFLSLARNLAWVLPPVGFILLEPDAGTPVVILAAWAVVVYVAGARWTHLVGFALAALLLFTAAWYSGAIPERQKVRLASWLHPEADSAYHQRQSITAIGHGGAFGQGIFQGTQTRLRFIPEQETDFIFSAVGEEMGFVGGLLVIGLYGVLLWRCLAIATEAKDVLGRLLATGVTMILLIHVYWNLGMTIGVMPVKGIALPLVSYGGSNLLATLVGLGLVESIHMRRHKIAF